MSYLVLIGDCHIRKRNPVARTDDIWEACKKKLKFVFDLADEYDAPIIQAGDLTEYKYDTASFKTPFMAELLEVFDPKRSFYSCIGNHDVLGDRIEEVGSTALGILNKTGRVNLHGAYAPIVGTSEAYYIHPIHWKQDPAKKEVSKGDYVEDYFNIAVYHVMTWLGKEPYPGIEEPDAKKLLSKLPQFDLIVTGHNHETFHYTDKDGRSIINPGGLLRTAADETAKIPYCYLYNIKERSFEKIEIPHEKGVVKRDHIEVIEKREERLEEFINKIKLGFSISMDYESNLHKFMEKNKTPEEVREIIEKAIGE